MSMRRVDSSNGTHPLKSSVCSRTQHTHTHTFKIRDDEKKIPREFSIVSRKKSRAYMFLPMLEGDKESVKFLRGSKGMPKSVVQGQESHAFFSNFLGEIVQYVKVYWV